MSSNKIIKKKLYSVVSSNVSAGFTLIETMLTLMIIGLALVPMLVTQGNNIRTIARKSMVWERLLVAKQFLLSTGSTIMPDHPEFAMSKKIDTPVALKMSFTAKKVDQRSLVASHKQLYLRKVEYEWTDASGKQKDSIATLVVMPDVGKQAV